MKVINIYNQTFVGPNANNTSWKFSISPTFQKTRDDSKWRITVLSLALSSGGNTNYAIIFQSSDWTNGKSAFQLDNQPQMENTTLTFGIINASSNQQTITYAPTEWIQDTLSYNPFTVFDLLIQSLTPPTTGQMSMTLKFEEVLI
tara:strand:+ start:62 stop:496 length:435 start_codon:yes stop_codon:yes gene_type:complete